MQEFLKAVKRMNSTFRYTPGGGGLMNEEGVRDLVELI